MTINYEFKVRWGDTDAAGIVFYPNFYKWMNEATHEFFAKIGLPISTLFEEERIGIPLLETHCEFKSPLLCEDVVIVRSVVVEIRNKVFKVSHQFYRGEQLIAEGYEVRAWTLFKDKPKAQPIPDDVRKKMMLS
jgi:4-hydroxybenzoyl-CoA thioesterase